MSERLTDRSCESFASVLAAKESVPGGGGAAALVGALGVALCSMVGNFTTGKKTYAAVEDDVQRMLAEAQDVRLRLIALVEEDAEAFYPLSQAYAIPRDDPKRAEVLEEATKAACLAPVEMMRQICHAIELL
ncbi:MAG: cyclodeaminase/cyclohydrolase family protein, partial [Atopobiaceae bacterium]|nr:cyclodeaminase/cyclohydrolase family protein [Atopobiaceae bacterium]